MPSHSLRLGESGLVIALVKLYTKHVLFLKPVEETPPVILLPIHIWNTEDVSPSYISWTVHLRVVVFFFKKKKPL